MYLTGVLLAALGLPTVAIDLPVDTPPETVARVVDSCNAALGEQRCEAARASGNNTTLLAVVRFQGAALDIRLFRGSAVRTEVERRSVAFSEDDAAPDRYIAAGLMVAALTAAQPQSPTETTPPPPEPVAPPPPPPPPPVVPEEPSATPLHLGMDLGFQAGQGLDSRHPKLGGALQAWWLAHSPRFGASISVSYLYAGGPVDLSWTSGSAGVTGRLTDWAASVSVEISTEAMLQQASASAERDGIRRTANVLRWGGRIGSKIAFPLGGPIEPFLGWEVALLRPSFEVRLEEERIGSEGPLRFGLALGVRVVPFANQGLEPAK